MRYVATVLTVLTVTQYADERHSEHIFKFMSYLAQASRVYYLAENFYLHTTNLAILSNIGNTIKFISHNRQCF